MKILLVGGNRFLGFELLGRLILERHEVTVLALDHPPQDFAFKVRWLHVDRNDRVQLSRILGEEEFDVLIDNIAWEGRQVELMLEAVGHRVGRYILTSSTDIYGLHVPMANREDMAPLEPLSLEGIHGHERYIRGKRSCERALRDSNLPWVVVRPAIIVGRQDVLQPPRSSRSLYFPSRVLDGGPILLRDDDEAVYRVAWVRDVVSAILLVMRDERAIGQAYNVTGDEVWTSERLVRTMAAILGRAPEIVRTSSSILANAGLADYAGTPYGLGPYWAVPENRKLKALGWRPTSPEIWMRTLLEAPVPYQARIGWSRRLQEIALAKKLSARPPPTGLPVTRLIDSTPLFMKESPLQGMATQHSTRVWMEYVQRAVSPSPCPAHYRDFGDLKLSSIGIGTHMGNPDAATDQLYIETIMDGVRRGINVIDTANNYRGMKSERLIGRALQLLAYEGFHRAGIVICSKGGSLAGDADDPRPYEQYVRECYLAQGLVDEIDVGRCLTLSPTFLRKQIDTSLANLNLEKIDLYYLHNPERQRSHRGPANFRQMLTRAFAVFEEAVASGKIGCYGVATWEGFRLARENPSYLAIEEIVGAATDAAGGNSHHLKALQLPLNLTMMEAYTYRNQSLRGQLVTILEAAKALGLYVFSSSSIGMGGIDRSLIERELIRHLPDLNHASAALQFTRSTPGLGTALVGMKRKEHLEDALRISITPPLPQALFDEMLSAV